jgi:hypothetical protein
MNIRWSSNFSKWQKNSWPHVKETAKIELMRLAATSILWAVLGTIYVIADEFHMINDNTEVPKWLESSVNEVTNAKFLVLESLVLLSVLYVLVKIKQLKFASIIREEISRLFYTVGVFTFVFSFANDFSRQSGFDDWMSPAKDLFIMAFYGFSLLIVFECLKSDNINLAKVATQNQG